MNEQRMILFEQIRTLVEQARGRAARAVNQTMVETYWHIGRLIVEEEQGGESRAVYGVRLIPELSRRLTQEYGKGFSETNLKTFRQFFLVFPIRHALSDESADFPEKRDAVRTESREGSKLTISNEKSPIPTTSFLCPELRWTHYRLLLRVENPRARDWYMREAAEAGWSSRALERQISSHYYERLLASQDREKVQAEARTISSETALRPADALKDPYIFEFLGLPSQTFLEKDLEKALLDNLQQFLLELGRGFSFVDRQYRVNTETMDFFVDLVFYHFRLKCFVLIDLKTGILTHQDIGQMDMYVRLFDDRIRQENDNPTIGLILCSQKDKTIVHYSVLQGSEQLFASEYRLYLPSEEELKAELDRERAMLLQVRDNDET
jgi:predicted nuclease of restriction endonuclease-like (RecB) superfamily